MAFSITASAEDLGRTRGLTFTLPPIIKQNEMFPKVKASSLDVVELGVRMAARKADLLANPS